MFTGFVLATGSYKTGTGTYAIPVSQMPSEFVVSNSAAIFIQVETDLLISSNVGLSGTQLDVDINTASTGVAIDGAFFFMIIGEAG